MPSIVVTGASHGIGRALAVAFAGEPEARLALVSRDETLLEQTRKQCQDRGAETIVRLCDVTDDEGVRQTASSILERWGAPDVLVNNAGIFEPGTIRETTAESFRRQVEANLTSAFLVTQAFLDSMAERRSGHIFFTASVASIRAYPSGAAYCAAKHGLLGLARSLREETKQQGLRVTALMPGATFTRSWEGAGLAEDRFIPAEDIGSIALEIYRLSRRSVVEEILIRPQLGDI